jgi:hypothetical protein
MMNLLIRCTGRSIALVVLAAGLPVGVVAQPTNGNGAGDGEPAEADARTFSALEARELTATGAPITLALRVGEAPLVDGDVLSDAAYEDARVATGFVQNRPFDGQPASERTEVRIVHTEDTLYFGIVCYTDDPATIIAADSRRDSDLTETDSFRIILDTYHDGLNGFVFGTNPAGVEYDGQLTNEGQGSGRFGGGGSGRPSNSRQQRGSGGGLNVNWDGVWQVATSVTDVGWTAEIAIPFRTLRYPPADVQTWGMNFQRNIRFSNEQAYWSPLPRQYTLNRLTLAGELQGLRVPAQRNLQLMPYALGDAAYSTETAQTSRSGDVGVDLKYSISPSMTLDATYNTDFAQVEVDEQQVNLTRFSLFFPEKRDFFLENAGMFNVGARGSGFGRMADLFFTRRIGLSDRGQPIPIVGGARLTGKVNRHNVAAMNITTQSAFGNPGDSFFVGRYSRDILARSKVGGIVIDKQAVGSVFAPDTGGVSHYNRTFAADTTLAVHRNLTMTGFVAKTQTPGLTSGDMASYGRATWLSPAFHVYTEFADLQENFNPEVGFVPRLGIRTSKFHGEWNPRPDRWNIRMFDPMWNITYTTDQHNRLLTRRIHNMIGTYFEDGSSVMFYFNDHFEQLDIPFDIRNTGVTVPAGTYRFGEWVFSYQSDPSRRLYTRTRYSPQTFFEGTRTDIQATVGFRATSRISAETIFNRSDVDLPWGEFVADLASLRLDLTLSPTVTLRSLSQYNSLTGELSNSIRFNWIYSPGSDIYVAYDEMRLDDLFYLNPHVRRSPWGDIRNRQIAIKMTYLLSR